MPLYSIQAPDGNTYSIEGPEGASQEDVARAVLAQTPEAGIPKVGPKPEGGFVPATKAGLASLKSDIAGVLGRTGLMDIGAAEKYRAEQEAYKKETFKPTEAGWTEEPITKIKELLGGSAPYMAAPLVAGGAAALAGAPALVGAGAAGLASAAQFTGSNLARQVEEGTPLAKTDIKAAALASVPQAALDLVGFKMLPGIRRMFSTAGAELAPDAAAAIAKEGLKKVAADYALATGKAMSVEGLTEAGQQVFERLQAGLNLTDPEARKEYFDNFVGGAVLGGVIAPAGRYVERGREQQQAVQRQQEEAAKTAAETAATQQAADAAAAQAKQVEEAKPEFAQNLRQQYIDAVAEAQRLSEVAKQFSGLTDPLSVQDAKEAKAARDAYVKETVEPLVEEIRRVRPLHPGFSFSLPAATPAAPAPAAPAPAAPAPAAPAPAAPAPAAPAPAAPAPAAPAPVAPAPVAPAPVAPAPVAPAPVTAAAPKVPKRVKKVEEAPVVSEPAGFEAAPPVAETPAPAAPLSVEDTTVEPTEPRTLEQVMRSEGRNLGREGAPKGQLLIPGAAPLQRRGIFQTPELLQKIKAELKDLNKEFITARQEGRKADARAVLERIRYLKEQTDASEIGPVLRGAVETGESEVVEQNVPERTSLKGLKAQIDRVRSSAGVAMTDEQADLLDRIERNLNVLAGYQAPTTGRLPALETTTAVPEAARGAGDTRTRIADWLQSLQEGVAKLPTDFRIGTRALTRPNSAEMLNLRAQVEEIERSAQQRVSPRELAGMLARLDKRTDLSRRERGMLRLVEENESAIMGDADARMRVADWIDSDVGQGIGDATAALNEYFGIGVDEGVAESPRKAALDARAKKINAEYDRALRAIDEIYADASVPLRALTANIERTKVSLQNATKRAPQAVLRKRLASLEKKYRADFEKQLQSPQIADRLAAAQAWIVEARRLKTLQDAVKEAPTEETRVALDKLMPLEIGAAPQVAPRTATVKQPDMFAAEIEEETAAQAARDAAAASKVNKPLQRKAEQEETLALNRLSGDLAKLPGQTISVAKRRAMLDEIDDAPAKRMALKDKINDANLSEEERAAAGVKLKEYLDKLRTKAANKDATYATAYRLRKEEVAAAVAAKDALDKLDVNDPKRAAALNRFKVASNKLAKRDISLARKRGVEISPTLSAKERQAEAEAVFEQTYGQAVTEEYAEYAAKQPQQRETGPVSRKAAGIPGQLYTGDPEATARTRTAPEKISVARGIKERDVPLTEAEMKEANVVRPKLSPQQQTLKEQAELEAFAAKRVEKLKSEMSGIEDAIDAYKRQYPKSALPEKLENRQRRITSELAAAQREVARLKVPAAKEKPEVAATMVGETGSTKVSAKVRAKVGKLRGVSGPNDTPLSPNNIDLLVANDLVAVLDNIAEQSENPVAQRIAGKLAAVAEANDVTSRVVEVTTADKPNAPGMTSLNGRRVYINERTGLSEETVVHEAAHAATMFELEKTDAQLTADQRDAKEELTRMMETVKADPAFNNEVIQDGDIHEFVAEGLGSKAVQAYMRKTDWVGGSLWRGFVQKVLNFIGIKTPAKGPMLDRFLDLAEKFIRARDAAAAPQIERMRSTGSLLSPTDVKYANPALAAAGATGDAFIARNKGVAARIRAASGGFLGLETQLVDRFAPLERISKTMDALKGSQMMYYLRMYDQRMNLTAQSVANGALQRVAKKRKDGGTEYVIESVDGASIKQVVDILKKAPAGSPDAANRLFTLYLAGIRAKNKGFDKLHFGDQLTPADLDKAMASIRATPGLEENFKQARDVYNEYNRNMVNFLAQSGAISKEHAARLTKENDYIPFYREREGVAELAIGGEDPIRIGSIAEQPYLRELVGGDTAILDFLTSSVQNTSLLTDMSLRNLATRNAAIELSDMGLAQIRPGPGAAGTKVVRFKLDGKDQHAIIDTDSVGIPADLLVKGMQGIPTQMPAVVRVLGMPATLLRRAVTLSPVYAARQLFRDSLAAPLLSGADFVPVLGALKEVGKSITKATLEKRGVTGGQVFTGTSEDMSKILKDMLAGRGNLGTLIAKAEALNMEADAATRRAQYNSYIKQGLSEMEATLMALESMNFNKRGASPSVHIANSLIPFFNSQIQGLNVLYKALAGKLPFDKRLKIQEKLLTRGALMFGASLAYAAMMQDDEAYKNATPEQKYGNWFVRFPFLEEPVKLPIPFEVGYFFKALPEALYNMMADKHGAEEAFKAFKTIILQTIPGGSSYGIPQAIKPAIEYGLGKSFYTGRDTLSKREQGLLPEEQFREKTSELAKMMGSGLGLSPIKIEALVSGYTGTMGLALMQLLSMGVPTGESPEKTAKRLSDLPVVGGSFQPNDAGGIINAVYERMSEVKKVKDTVDRMLAEGRADDALKLINKRSDEFAQSGMADYYMSHMQQVTKFENAIRASGLSGPEKREQIDQLRQIKIMLAKTVQDAADSVKKAD